MLLCVFYQFNFSMSNNDLVPFLKLIKMNILNDLVFLKDILS